MTRKKTKHRIIGTLLITSLMLALAGCSTATKIHTYKLSTGDIVEVTLKIADNYDMTLETPIDITSDDIVIGSAYFIDKDAYIEYAKTVDTDPRVKLIEDGEKDGNNYIFWFYNNGHKDEWNRVILLKDSNTAVFITNRLSENTATECFDRLDFEMK